MILPKILIKDTGLSLDAESTRVKRPRTGAVLWRSPSPACTEERQKSSTHHNAGRYQYEHGVCDNTDTEYTPEFAPVSTDPG